MLLLLLSFIASAPVKIMPLGDSITGGPGCWRALLWQKLQQNGYTNIDFVGTLPPQQCSVQHDGDNEGHIGVLAIDTANANDLVGWLARTNPDIVVMHFGTNDVWNGRPTQTILDAFSTLLQQMRQNNPKMILLVAQIIPVAPSSCPDCPQRTTNFNNALVNWVNQATTSQSPVILVDCWTGWNSQQDTYDGVHPSDPSGITKLANSWYPTLARVLDGFN
jgi:lysophospholipase L1-like esterase